MPIYGRIICPVLLPHFYKNGAQHFCEFYVQHVFAKLLQKRGLKHIVEQDMLIYGHIPNPVLLT